MTNKPKLLIVDAGHGGVVRPGGEHSINSKGIYFTVGKRSPEIPPGFYEGEFNRDVASRIKDIGVENVLLLNPGPINVPLFTNKKTKRDRMGTRVGVVNEIVDSDLFDVVLISIHANAMGSSKSWSTASGSVVFTTEKPSQKTTRLAMFVLDNISGPGMIKCRGIKSSNFTIISAVRCPAVLIESGFMTSLDDVKILSDPAYRSKLSMRIWKAVYEYWGSEMA